MRRARRRVSIRYRAGDVFRPVKKGGECMVTVSIRYRAGDVFRPELRETGDGPEVSIRYRAGDVFRLRRRAVAQFAASQSATARETCLGFNTLMANLSVESQSATARETCLGSA